MEDGKTKLSHEEFFKSAIVRLRNASKSRGIHSVYSGFNEAFRQYFREDPIAITQQLAREGKIEIRPVKQGVMIYLPGEAPKTRNDVGQAALSKILAEPGEKPAGLIEKAVTEICPNGVKSFPNDFSEGEIRDDENVVLTVPGTSLQIDQNSQTLVTSPRRHFRYEARNPSEAKYIIYGHSMGQTKISVPKDNRTLFKIVANYEKYCEDVRSKAFSFFLKETHDEALAEVFTKDLVQAVGLKSLRE